MSKEELEKLKTRLDYRLNEALCEMKPEYDDSITGFNEAWDIMNTLFLEELKAHAPSSNPPESIRSGEVSSSDPPAEMD